MVLSVANPHPEVRSSGKVQNAAVCNLLLNKILSRIPHWTLYRINLRYNKIQQQQYNCIFSTSQ